MRRAVAVLVVLSSVAVASCVEPISQRCGDGARQVGEECDDGNNLPGDGCGPSCELECGNFTTDPGEECDDGNRDSGDGCDSSCRLECGNGRLDPGEECEHTLTSGCGTDCRWSDGTDGDADADGDVDGDTDADTDGDADADADGDDVVLELAPSGGSVTRSGQLDSSSATWHRPIGSCSSLSTTAESSPWDGYTIHNGLGSEATVTIDVLADSSGAGTLADPLAFLYDGTALPSDALSCVGGNDDGGEGREPRIEGVVMAPGERYFVVVTSFSDDPDSAYGSYQLVVTTD